MPLVTFSPLRLHGLLTFGNVNQITDTLVLLLEPQRKIWNIDTSCRKKC